jgi:O-antigen/teichoic acid export membrane protein
VEHLVDNAKVVGRGATTIFFSNMLLTLISAVGAIVVIRLLSPVEYGLYTIAFIPANMVMLFNDWGVWSAMTKHIAQYRSE